MQLPGEFSPIIEKKVVFCLVVGGVTPPSLLVVRPLKKATFLCVSSLMTLTNLTKKLYFLSQMKSLYIMLQKKSHRKSDFFFIPLKSNSPEIDFLWWLTSHACGSTITLSTRVCSLQTSTKSKKSLYQSHSTTVPAIFAWVQLSFAF